MATTPIKISLLRGIVLSAERTNQTHVYSSGGGGGGYVGPHGGHVTVRAPQIHSQIQTSTDIYLRDAQGKEHHVLVWDSLQLRVGHDVEFAYSDCGRGWELCIFWNRSLEKWWSFRVGAPAGFGVTAWGFVAVISFLFVLLPGLYLLVMASISLATGRGNAQWYHAVASASAVIAWVWYFKWGNYRFRNREDEAVALAKKAMGLA